MAQSIRIYPDTLSFQPRRYAIAPYQQPLRKKVGLALSGGGARGLSHIGVLKAFEEKGIPIDAIAGTSMGAIVGGLYASGYSANDLWSLSQQLNWSELTALSESEERRNLFLEQKHVRDKAALTLQFSGLRLIIPKSLSAAQKLTETLDLLTLQSIYKPEHSDFLTLPIPFCAIATDLVSGRRVILRQGSLSEAMRASSAVPLLFAPIEQGSLQLADGGLLSNIPVDVLDSLGVDYKLAVKSTSPLYESSQDLDLPWQAADQVIGIMMQEPNRKQLQLAHRVIEPHLNGRSATNFERVEELLYAGYEAALVQADRIKADIKLTPKNDFDICGYEKRIVGIEPCAPYAERITRIAEVATGVKAALAEFLETDYFTRVFAEVDTVSKIVTFHLCPTPRFTAVVLHGAQQEMLRPAQALFDSVCGRPYTNRDGMLLLERVLRLYREKGYALARLRRVAILNDTLHIEVDTGKLIDVSIWQSRGWAQRFVIEREMKVRLNEPLRTQDVRASISGLYNTGIFNRVSMWTEQWSDSSQHTAARLQVKLDERFFELLRVGVRFDDIYTGQLFLDFRNENFLGAATELGGWAMLGQRSFLTQAEFRVHRLWQSYVTLFARAFYEQRNVFGFQTQFAAPLVQPERQITGEYAQRIWGISAAVGWQLYRDGSAIVECIRARNELVPLSLSPAQEAAWITTLRTRFTVDTRNAALGATEGAYTNIYYDFSPSFLGSDISFSKIFFSHEENASWLGGTLVGRLRLSAGFADNTTPFIQQFSLGGIGSQFSATFYGLRLDELRGRQLIAAGLEAQVPLPIQLVVPTFFSLHYNIGNIWQFASDVKLRDFLHGIGAEISLKTPIGLARLATAISFRLGEFERTTFIQTAPPVFYFALGYEF
ncbi:MAG: patatin-like phospholipase family protein [Chloroherpetonaceae bacterium]|nr:patatin-like phospholipase family protein [Chloroherpetonaceae bacterium]